MDISRVQHLIPTPRNNLKALYPKPLTFSKKYKQAWESSLRFGELVLIAVVQANRSLYDKRTASFAPAVVLYTTDPARRLDGQFLHAVVDQVHEVKEHPHLTDPELLAVQQVLRNEQSDFHLTLPPKLTWGTPSVMKVEVLNASLMPGGCIPPERLLPAIIGRNPRNEDEVYLVKSSAYR